MRFFNKHKILFAAYCLLSVIIIINYKHENQLFHTIRAEVLEIIAPAISKVSQVMYFVDDIMNNSKNLFVTFEENKKLKERNDFLEYYFYKYKQVAEENNELRSELNTTKEIVYPFTTAQVIGKSNNYLHKEIIINAGSKNGIKKWQMALFHNNLIGRVITVSDNTSSVLLITDNASKIPVMSLNSKVKFIAAGQSNNSLFCSYLGDSKPEENELVVTSYDNPLILPNIIIGTVFQKDGNYYITPNVDINKIEFVQILQPSND